MNNKRLGLIGLLSVMVIGIIIVSVTHSKDPAKNAVLISGLEKCSKHIKNDRVESLGGNLYVYVSLANSYNKIKSVPTYNANVRSNGCGKTTSHEIKGNDGRIATVYTSRVLVDVPEAKQSWLVQYDWMDTNKNTVDLESLTATCPTSNELKYGDFNCTNVLSLQKYGTANYDPILEYMPYTGEGFTLKYYPDSKQVTATILIPTNQKGNQELIENNKAVIPYWFEKRNLDINKYTVVYEVTYR